MISFRLDRKACFVLAFLVLNACGWWWVKQRSPQTAAPQANAAQASQAVPVSKPLAAVSLDQTALSPERRLSLSLVFNGPVDWPSLGPRLKLCSETKPLAWRFVGKNRSTGCQIQTVDAVSADRVEVRIEPGVKPASPEYAALAVPVVQVVPVVPQFRFAKLEPCTPAFGQPYVSARFTQAADVREAAALIECSPPVRLAVTPEPWGNELRLEGAFEIGTAYTFTFKPGLRSREGHRLEQEVRRTVLIQHRAPSLAIPVDGRYLAPDGALAVPVLAVNTKQVVSSLSRVLPQNLVQYALREAGLASGWWRSEPSELARELTLHASVRTNAVAAAPDQEQRLLLRLGDYGQEPVRGVFVLDVSAPDVTPRSRLVCVTDLGLSARTDKEAVTVWVTALRTGCPAPNVHVELYGRNNLLWAQGETDARGLVRLPRRAEEGEPFLVFARTGDGGDSVALPLTDSQEVERSIGEDARGYVEQGRCEAFLMSDRDIYRHGESVFVQALLRTADGRPPASFPVVLHVLKPDGRTFKTVPLVPDALGAVFAQVTLPEYLPSGTYGFELRLPGEGALLGEHAVMLEAFVPPQIRIQVQGAPERARLGEELSFKVFAEHLFGKPAQGLGAEASLALSAAEFKPKAWEGFLFGDAEKSLATRVLRAPRQTLAADGTASFSIQAAVDGLPPAQVRAAVNATVTETGGRTVSARTEVALDPYPFYIGIRPGPERVVRVNTRCTLALAAVAPDGTRRADKTPLDVKIERVSWVSCMRKEPSGKYRWESERVKAPVSEDHAETGPENTAYAFSVASAGDYVITFTDPASRASSSWSFAAEEEGQTEGRWDHSKPDRVDLVFDKDAYKPGETARLQVRAPFAGQAWVSVGNDRLLESRVIALTNNTASLEWPLTDACAPNLEIAVSVVRPAVAESVWSAHRAMGEAVLRVRPPERKLTVRVQCDAEVWHPKSTASVRVAVADSEGRPAGGAAVTVLAVDEGVCLLTQYETPDPYGFFSAARSGGLQFFDAYRNLMPIATEAMFGTASHVGGDGGDELLKRLNPVAARRFKPVALWQANVKTDASGSVAVPFELPEFAGELRVMAVAWNERAVGSDAAPVKVRRKLVVQPDLPRFLAPGDRASVLVALHNESGEACTAKLALQTRGPIACDASARDVAMKSGESVTVPLPVTAREQAGAAQITVRVEGAGEVYEEPIDVAVRPASALRVVAEYAVLNPGETKRFEPPAGALEKSFSQSFVCSAQPSINLLGALDYVENYPYGCLEQTVSSALPLLALGDWVGRLSASTSTLPQEAPARIHAALLRILSMQRWDGFAMWPDVVGSDPQNSVYAAFFLVQAAQSGYALPANAVPDALRALRNRLPNEEDASRAFICHVLALAGQPDHGWMLRLYEQSEALSPEDRFHLARALLRSGEVDKGRALLVQSQAVGGLREAALALLAWLELDPANPFVSACCHVIDKARRPEDGHWGTTRDNALALLAMGAYLQRVPERPQTFAPTLRWGDQTKSVAATNAYTWVPDADADGGVQMRNEGPGPMYVARRVSYVPLAAQEKPVDSGVSVRREWLDLQGAPINPAALRRGDLVIVRLTLDPLERASKDVVVEELLPAGLEIENAQLAAAGTLPWIKADEAEWVLHREVRDDRLLLFANPISGVQRFHYAARAVSAGEFVVPAVAASAMYDPGTFSRHGLGRVKVE